MYNCVVFEEVGVRRMLENVTSQNNNKDSTIISQHLLVPQKVGCIFLVIVLMNGIVKFEIDNGHNQISRSDHVIAPKRPTGK